MRFRAALLALTAASLAVLNSGCQKLEARDSLNKGVRAFKDAKYTDAAEDFKKAVALDPDFSTARLYLATAYYMQYNPGADTPDNLQYANRAKDEYLKVLQADPKNVLALSSIASLYFNQKKFDDAEQWYRKVIQADPNNRDAYYTLGVIAWSKWLPVDRQARIDSKMRPEDPGPIKDAKIREDLKPKWMPLLDQGVKDEERALQIDPGYPEGMAYMNLLIRYRADLLDTPDAYKQATGEADNWMAKSLEASKALAAKKATQKTE